MQLRSLALLAVGAFVATTVSPASAATPAPKYFCNTDTDCEKYFPGTICIEVDNYGEITKKCTPNTKTRPACKGGQPGLCPSYQSPESSYLNVHCVFVAKDTESTGKVKASSSSSSSSSSSGSGPAKVKRERWLMVAAVNKTGNGTTVGDVVAPAGSGAGTVPAVSSGDYATVRILNQTITGEFKCVDVSDCANQAFDPSTCEPLACGSPKSKDQCNNHGTCTYPSIQTMSKRTCMCYAGFGGDKCQQEISNECDVDCGFGGDCVDGVCKCKKGYDGVAYKGQKGKPNQRCTKCTNDQACQNGNTCDLQTGACVCQPGYSGPTCGATEDGCMKMNCGVGTCQLLGNMTGACYCPICAGACELCPTKDCSTCPSAASAIEMSKMAVFVAALALVISNTVF
jgi:hypothetical protein